MHPQPLFEIFGQGVHLYGIFIAIGLVACLVVFYLFTKHKKMPSAVQDFVFYVAIIAIALGFVSAKLFQAVYDWIAKGTFDFANAGITAMGGFIGGAGAFIAVYFGWGHFYFKKKGGIHKQWFNTILLTAPSCIVIAHMFGRIGCLCAGCCHGAYLGEDFVIGGIYMQGTVNNIHTWGYFVPTQLYEALFLLVLFAVLMVFYFKDFNITMQIYLIGYGIWRIAIEVLRTDYRGGGGALSPSQWQSIIFIVGGLAMFVLYYLLKFPFRFKNGDYSLRKKAIADTPLEDSVDKTEE